MLDHVTEKNLHKISHISGYVEDISKLAQRCRNITNLDIHVYLFTEDVSGLAALTTLHTLQLTRGDYAECNLNTVLSDIGHRLTDLNLNRIKRVILQNILTQCPSLSSLTLLLCTLFSLDPDTQLDPQLLQTYFSPSSFFFLFLAPLTLVAPESSSVLFLNYLRVILRWGFGFR
jgi:hypothetical protein